MKILIANWKMNPATLSEAVLLAAHTETVVAEKKIEAIIAPPFPSLMV